jgi:nucleotide-binding universal stress UspA family protein
MFANILVPLDESALSLQALKYAAEIALKFAAQITLIEVIKPSQPIAVGEPGSIISPSTAQSMVTLAQQSDRDAHDKARQFLKVQADELIKRGLTTHYTVLSGNPADEIIKYSHEQNIELVVMTTRGHSGLKRAILGSVADVVVRDPGVPALIIRI